MQIGCQNHSIENWKNFSDNEIAQMHEKALTFWCKNKQFIFTLIEQTTSGD
jgi:hypothetical protein